MPEPIPHAVQKQALMALNQSRSASKIKALSVLPSGIGKTHLAAFDAKKSGAKKILYISHRREILEQAIEIFRSVYNIDKNDSSKIGIVIGKVKQLDRDMLFATIQTLWRPKVLPQLSTMKFDYVVVDEYHHIAADTYQQVLNAISTDFLVGLTATPYRLDGKDILKDVDGNVVYEMNLESGIKKGYLVPFAYHALYDNIDYSDIKWHGYRYREKDLNNKLIIDRRDNQIIDEYKKSILPTKRRTMIFCVSVKHTQRMADKLRARGIKADALVHRSRLVERRRIIKDFREGRTDVLCIRDIFNEGIDFPEVSAIMFLRPTSSRTVFFQQLGRGLRKSTIQDKRDVLVFDFVSNYQNAYRIKEWLGFATQVTHRHKLNKPEYFHNVPLVYFDKKVLDIFELQKRNAQKWNNPHTITKDLLIDEYIRISRVAGFFPRAEQFKDRDRFEKEWGTRPKYSVGSYIIHFESWAKFCQEVGVNFFKNPRYFWRAPKEKIPDMIKNYWEVKKRILNDNPSLKETPTKIPPMIAKILDDSSISRYAFGAYNKHFGTWYNFLASVNDEQYARPSANMYGNQWIKGAYEKLANKLGRRYISDTDWRGEYGKRGRMAIQRRFHGFSGLRRTMNNGIDVPPPKIICIWCKKEFVPSIHPSPPNSKYCSRDCGNRYHYWNTQSGLRNAKLSRMINCVQCGKPFCLSSIVDTSKRLPVSQNRLSCSEECRKARRHEMDRRAKQKMREEKGPRKTQRVEVI